MDATLVVHLMGGIGVALFFVVAALWRYIQTMFARQDGWADAIASALEEAKLDIAALQDEIKILKEKRNGKTNDKELGH